MLRESIAGSQRKRQATSDHCSQIKVSHHQDPAMEYSDGHEY